ncbi:M66 family metalloprotease [Cedecea sp.]|jgi:hypothetical protein|uniref:M66 family metalloprotease n=1 Tax=Cedecea sp. TaxID=1970739 RepID=UPI0012AEB1C0|nr:peptidase M66 [Enterobacteriaceae bacterium RIT693]
MRLKYLAAAVALSLPAVMVFPQAMAGTSVFLDENTLTNNLQGSLAGSIKFAQTHTIDATGNSAKEMPRLTSTRDTLVMLIPSGPAVKSLTLKARNNKGELLGTLEMRTPAMLPGADRPANSPNPDVRYSDKAWSQILPGDWIQPGLTLEFNTTDNRSGKIDSIDIGGETQVVLQNIRIGMLTAPGSLDKNPLEKTSQKLADDYFQKIPVSELIVGNYSPVELQEVVLSSGKKYTTSSDDTGGVYDGDMRENIGKGLISMGIDNANFGINSSKGETQWQPGLFHQVAVHQSWGRYKNGVVQHGLSGGNGMATLYDTVGNEFSHEIGHGYGMGHYPGGGKWSIHNRHSGWGWDSIQHRFIANFFWNKGGDTPAEESGDTHVTPPFLGIYKFNRDTMGGGEASSPLSKYTLHTGYTQKRIQQWLEDKAVIAAHSPSGYLIWDRQQKKMVAPTGPLYRKPDAFGIPVVTLVGYYDPQGELESYIYPALHGSYGYTYKSEPLKNGQCWAEVSYANGSEEIFALDGMRLQPGHMNKFHINVPENKKPQAVSIACPQQNMDAAFTQWKLKKFGVEKFYHWDTDKNEAIGSVYYYPQHDFYFRLKSKPFWYFPTTPVDNQYWTYLTDEASLRQEYQSQPVTLGNEFKLAERSIEPAAIAPQPAAKTGHLYEEKESEAPAPEVTLDRSVINVVGTTDSGWGYPVTGTSNQKDVSWTWHRSEGNSLIYLKSYDKASAEVVVPKNLFDTATRFCLTATNRDKKSGEACVAINVTRPAVTITGQSTMPSAAPIKLEAKANFDQVTLRWSLKRGNRVIENGITQDGQLQSGLAAGEYIAEVTASSSRGGRTATSQHKLTVTQAEQNNDQAFISALTLTIQPKEQDKAVIFSGSVQSSQIPTSTPDYHWTLPVGADNGSNGQPQQQFTLAKTSQVQHLKVAVKVTAGKASGVVEQAITVPALTAGDVWQQWVYGTRYENGQVVQHNGKLFECTVANWCSQTGQWSQLHYEPGVGISWTQAWKSYSK